MGGPTLIRGHPWVNLSMEKVALTMRHTSFHGEGRVNYKQHHLPRMLAICRHPWSRVVAAFWRKYPNDNASHVRHVDTFRRSYDAESGDLTTYRLITCTNKLPSWIAAVRLPRVFFAFRQCWGAQLFLKKLVSAYVTPSVGVRCHSFDEILERCASMSSFSVGYSLISASCYLFFFFHSVAWARRCILLRNRWWTAKPRRWHYSLGEYAVFLETTSGSDIEKSLSISARSATPTSQHRALRWSMLHFNLGCCSRPSGTKL